MEDAVRLAAPIREPLDILGKVFAVRFPVKAVSAAVGAVAVATLLVGCGGSATDGGATAGPTAATSSAAASSSADVLSPAVLVDVRTPQEFAEGHLEGAVNIPVESADFAAQVAAIAAGGQIDLYCRSGNRSSQAAALLDGSGLTVVDLGGYDQAAAETGLPTVR